MSGGELDQNLKMVKTGIEQCILKYMSKKEAINTLFIQHNIEPDFTELVWEKLEKDNQEFFKAYYVKLLVKDQIKKFNRLLSKQEKLMRINGLTGITPVLTSNGAHVSSTQQMPTKRAAQTTGPPKTEDMRQLNMFHNCGSSVQSCVQGIVDGSIHSRQIDVSHNSLSQNPNRFVQTVIKTEDCYACGPPFNFSTRSNFLESRPRMGDASVSPFSSVGSNAQHPDDTVLNWNSSSFRPLERNRQSFSPELAADFTSNSGDVEWLDPSSERLRYPFSGGA